MRARRPWLLPLVPVYRWAVAAKERIRGRGWLKQNRLEGAVISVGSLSAGGAGKTPFVLMLARVLRQRGYAVRILTRGYKRNSQATSRVEAFDDPRWHGDEPVLLAQRSGVPVFVGADRYKAGIMAEQAEPEAQKSVVHLLDDGFQHRQLARDVDIVLLTEEDVTDTLLPGGNLREPLSMLVKADVVVLREDEAEHLRGVLRALDVHPIIWVIRRQLSLGEGGSVGLPTMPVAFCGIARPEGFTKMLAAQGYEPIETVRFPDHHAYADADMQRLLEAARRAGANGFVTTEKDAVKLTPLMQDRLEMVGPVVVGRLCVELVDEKEAMAEMVERVRRLDRRRR